MRTHIDLTGRNVEPHIKLTGRNAKPHSKLTGRKATVTDPMLSELGMLWL